jgi:hypothetical protein
MVGEIKIYWKKRKEKPSVETIKELTKDNDIEIYNAPLETFKKLLELFKNYDWKIYEDENSEISLNKKMYWLNEEILTQGLSSVHYIFISSKQDRYPYAYAVLRRGD